jgi:hypothetical protein
MVKEKGFMVTWCFKQWGEKFFWGENFLSLQNAAPRLQVLFFWDWNTGFAQVPPEPFPLSADAILPIPQNQDRLDGDSSLRRRKVSP